MPKSSGVGVSRARSREICVCTSSPAPPLLHLYPAPILARHPMLAILDSCKDDTLLLARTPEVQFRYSPSNFSPVPVPAPGNNRLSNIFARHQTSACHLYHCTVLPMQCNAPDWRSLLSPDAVISIHQSTSDIHLVMFNIILKFIFGEGEAGDVMDMVLY